MKNVLRTLSDSDRGLLPVLAQVWQINIERLPSLQVIETLAAAMLEEERAEKVWASLNDDQRGALQALLGSGGKMPATMYSRLFGEIRQMGAAQIEREQPLTKPQSSAEALFYRGLIAQAFEQVESGARPIIYVPDDLIPVLPSHKTSYEHLEAETAEPEVEMGALEEVDNVQQADTSIVDDLTTLLAYLQLFGAQLEEEILAESERETLLRYMLNPSPTRLAFLLGVGLAANLILVEDNRATTHRAEARRWLSQPRSAQVKALVDAWRSSPGYRDLRHVPGLKPESLPNYDPVVARGALVNFLLEIAPNHEWWSVDEFIEIIKVTDADFMRPGGDYDSWYIRGEAGEYLKGFESWDAVEGALLEFYLTGPMHWLGLTDLADDAARLTAYGRAFLDMIPWPTPPDPEEKVIVEADGHLLVSRRVSRIDRFQVARFTTWGPADDPYTYILDGPGIAQAEKQGINTQHISAFLGRMLDDAPSAEEGRPTAGYLERWPDGDRQPGAPARPAHAVAGNAQLHPGDSCPASLSGRAVGVDGGHRARRPVGSLAQCPGRAQHPRRDQQQPLGGPG